MQIELTIVLIGNINAGKSSIINALLGKEVAETGAKGGTTLNIGRYSFKNNSLSIQIIDTPGLSEVEGSCRANKAIEAADKGDLILFVVNNDLVDTEKKMIVRLHDRGKRVILVFNQIDKYTESQRAEIQNSLKKSVSKMIAQENIILVSASPLQKVIIREKNGEEELVERKGVADVGKLKERIVSIANKLGKHIDQIAGYVEEFIKIKKASDTSFNYAAMIGIGTAVNPIPFLDLFGGAAGISILVKKIANIYNVRITIKEAERLAKDMLLGMAALSAGTLLLLGIGSMVKMIPFVGWLVGGTAEAASVAFAVFIVGDTVSDYYANGQNWKMNNSLKESLEEKIQSVDRDQIIKHLKNQINEKLKKGVG